MAVLTREQAEELIDQYVISIGLTKEEVFNPELRAWYWQFGPFTCGICVLEINVETNPRVFLKVIFPILTVTPENELTLLRTMLQINDICLGAKVGLGSDGIIHVATERDINGMDLDELSQVIRDAEVLVRTLSQEFAKDFPNNILRGNNPETPEINSAEADTGTENLVVNQSGRANRRVPDIYDVELHSAPEDPALSRVATAVPVFIGYTEKAEDDNISRLKKLTYISSLSDYEACFGKGFPAKFKVRKVESGSGDQDHQFSIDNQIWQVELRKDQSLYLYNSIRLFYANGGCNAYILPLDTFGGKDSMPVNTSDFTDPEIYDLLKREAEPTMVLMPDLIAKGKEAYPAFVSVLSHCCDMQNRIGIFDLAKQGGSTLTRDLAAEFREAIGTENLNYGAAYYPWLKTDLVKREDLDIHDFEFTGGRKNFPGGDKATGLLFDLAAKLLNELPPSGALAGVYTKVDSTAGVWKAPADIALVNVKAPAVSLSDKEHENLSSAPDGKAINTIRDFKEKGVLVCGSGTLDGNSQDWRYMQVHRTMISIKNNVKNMVNSYVFEPNDANTWALAKTAVSDYLNDLWKKGALLGAKSEDAYQVNVGLGSSMTEQDIQDGSLILSVSVALTHPAEFIDFKFMQQMPKT